MELTGKAHVPGSGFSGEQWPAYSLVYIDNGRAMQSEGPGERGGLVCGLCHKANL